MNRYQTDIIWLGLILIALNIIVNFSEFMKVITSGSSSSSGSINVKPLPIVGQLNTPTANMV